MGLCGLSNVMNTIINFIQISISKNFKKKNGSYGSPSMSWHANLEILWNFCDFCCVLSITHMNFMVIHGGRVVEANLEEYKI